MEYMLFPRLAAVAEVGWTIPGKKDWSRFLKALDHFTERLAVKGVNFAQSMYNIQHSVTVRNGKLQVTLDCIRPDVEDVYKRQSAFRAGGRRACNECRLERTGCYRE